MEHTCEIDEKTLLEIQKQIPKQEEMDVLSNLFKMYADPTRLKILASLFQKELCVCDIAALLNMTHSAISHQLAVLRTNRIIKARKEGKKVYYSLDDSHIQLIFNNGLSHVKEE